LGEARDPPGDVPTRHGGDPPEPPATVTGITACLAEGLTPMADTAHPPAHDQAERHDPVYDRLIETAEFEELRIRFRNFVWPATAVFLGWYVLYVLASNWATGFMSHKLVGNINVALVFGLLQFVTTFVIAALYARYMNRRVDPIARQLEIEYTKGVGR
jgi:uncharacterized membrane protein (DUF485 family)